MNQQERDELKAEAEVFLGLRDREKSWDSEKLARGVLALIEEDAAKAKKIQRAENILAMLRPRLRDQWPAITLQLDAYEAKYGEARHG